MRRLNAMARSAVRRIAAGHFVGDLFQAVMSIERPQPRPAGNTAPMTTQPSILPPSDLLYQWFDEINAEFFAGQLPRVVIQYSSRMRCAGSYTPRERTIRLGVAYHKLFPDQLRDTLKHEMIHILNPTHNRAFRQEAARIGASRYATAHPSLRRPAKFLYHCPQCGLEYPRRKRLRLAHCGRCARQDGLAAGNKLKLSSSGPSRTADSRP